MINKCKECETNSETLEKQRVLLLNQDRRIQESHKVQKESRDANKELKKKMDEAVKVVEETMAENSKIESELQVQKDLVMALKLQLQDGAPKIVKDGVKVVEKEEGPLPEGERQCKKCNFQSKNRVLMQAHKDKYHKGVPNYSCLMCGSVAPNLDSFEKHKEKHRAELKIGNTNKYPMNVYTYKCKPCKLSFRNHDTLIDHMSSVHIPERQRQLKVAHEQEKSAPEYDNRPQHCKNGDHCYYHKQHRCNYFHAFPPPEQRMQSSRQSPSSEWKIVQNRRPRHVQLAGQRSRGGDHQQERGYQQWQEHRDHQQGRNQQQGRDHQQGRGYQQGHDHQQWQDSGDHQQQGRDHQQWQDSGDHQQETDHQQWQDSGDHQQGQKVEIQRKWGGSRDISSPWCRHVHNCLQGRFWVMRKNGEQDFLSQPFQGRQ